MQKTRKINTFIIFPLCQNLIQLELKILTILILILDITCYYVEIRSFDYITHFRKRIMWKIKSQKILKNRKKSRKSRKLLILMSFSFDDTVDVVYTWKYGGIHYRKTNKSKKLIFGMWTNKRMLYCPWVLVAIETRFYVFTLKYQYFEKSLREHYL